MLHCGREAHFSILLKIVFITENTLVSTKIECSHTFNYVIYNEIKMHYSLTWY